MADNSRGYAGIHSTIFAAIQFLNHLERADVSTMVAEDRICAICNETLSESPDQPGHWAVRLPGCGHVFGKSCLAIWLTPFDKESQEFSTEDSENEEEEEEAEEEEEENLEEEDDDDFEDCDDMNERRREVEEQWISRDLDNNPTGSILWNPTETSLTSNSMEIEDVMLCPSDELVAHLYTLVSWHPATRDDEMDVPISLQGDRLVEPALLYDFGPYAAGVAPTPLGAGNNTCPLCRSETFPRPKHGDSLMALMVRMHVWNTAYRYLGIERTAQDQLYMNEIGLFMRRRFDTWALNQVDPGLAEVFVNALHSLVGVGLDVEYRAFLECWTSQDMHRLWIFAESWKFWREDWVILFRLNPRDHLVAADVTQLRGWNQHYSERLTETWRFIEVTQMDLQISRLRR
ncbi:MAG: hypothetical protein LQ350_004979 [Teloschistes chrysophthalmus]|nr:MAG: hypothetical protein LQ350_004979 [Niorma chrysophthalma]